MFNKFWYILGVILGLLGLLFGPHAASAAVGSESGFLILSNPATGQEVAAWCEGGLMVSYAVIDGVESLDAEAPLSTPCSAIAMAGFVPTVNTSPSDGWIVSQHPIEGMHEAYACHRDGTLTYTKAPSEHAKLDWHRGSCLPGDGVA